jgi:predicted DNA binding CopG/RHH family protein
MERKLTGYAYWGSLDEEEQDIEAAFERGEYMSASDLPEQIKMWQKAVTNSLKKKPITVRVQERDIQQIRTMALEQGFPYQTLVSSILHRYATGRLKGDS